MEAKDVFRDNQSSARGPWDLSKGLSATVDRAQSMYLLRKDPFFRRENTKGDLKRMQHERGRVTPAVANRELLVQCGLKITEITALFCRPNLSSVVAYCLRQAGSEEHEMAASGDGPSVPSKQNPIVLEKGKVRALHPLMEPRSPALRIPDTRKFSAFSVDLSKSSPTVFSEQSCVPHAGVDVGAAEVQSRSSGGVRHGAQMMFPGTTVAQKPQRQ